MLKYIIIILLSIIFFTLIYSFPYLTKKVFETENPIILVKNIPKGFGNAKDNLTVNIKDYNSGIDTVVIRLFQGNKRIVLFKEKFQKKKETLVKLALSAKDLELNKGVARIQIRAFDSSFWNNKAEKNFNLEVDYQKPRISVLSSQHNIRTNGSQLIFYKVTDNNLYNHGIKFNNVFFPGFKASFIDKSFKEENLYASFFSIYENTNPKDVKIYAEDRVGNFESINFPIKILKGYSKAINKKYLGNIDLEEYIEKDLNLSFAKIFNSLNDKIYPLKFRNEFLRFPGVINTIYGNKIKFLLPNNKYYKYRSKYNEVNLTSFNNKVITLQSGIVTNNSYNKDFGKYIVIDHGANIHTLYGNLKESFVQINNKIEKGDTIGITGSLGKINSTLIKDNSLFFMLLIGDKPVEPKEWWDENWYNSHVKAKIQKLKVELGLIEISKGL